MNIRELVYKSLFSSEKDKKYSNIELSSKINANNLSGTDRAFFTSLFYGVTEKKITLDYFIKQYSSIPFSRLDLSAIILLRMGMYQILYMDKIPDSAAVNETVKIASRYSSRSKAFINAVLRKFSSEKNNLIYPDDVCNHIERLSVQYSIPTWICELWEKDYPNNAENIIKELSLNRPITFRVNSLRTDCDSITAKYDNISKCEYSPYGIRLSKPIPVSEFQPLINGDCFVQDEASQIAGLVLNPSENQIIIDACCAPGGKSFGAAMLTNDKAEIISCDVHENKLSLVKKEAEKLGIKSIKTFTHDSTSAMSEYIGKVDRVVCDVPCSGLGVISKKSDIKYKDEKSIEDIDKIQYDILSASSKYLKDGGILLYSTCTLRKKENEDVVEKFLNANPEFSLLPFEYGNIISDSGMLTLFPNIYHTDGFFMAKIIKNKQ